MNSNAGRECKAGSDHPHAHGRLHRPQGEILHIHWSRCNDFKLNQMVKSPLFYIAPESQSQSSVVFICDEILSWMPLFFPMMIMRQWRANRGSLMTWRMFSLMRRHEIVSVWSCQTFKMRDISFYCACNLVCLKISAMQAWWFQKFTETVFRFC